MHKNRKKVTFSGSLAWRTFIVCFLFLIIPLLVYTLLLYTQEIHLAEKMEALQKEELIWRVTSFFLLVFVLGGSLVFLFVRKLAKPLRSLCATMEGIKEGAIHARYAPQRWGFEINAIGKVFNEMLDQILVGSHQIEEERTHRIRLAEELKLGQKIQASLLASPLPRIAGLEISAGSIPAQEVGGDFYDVFPLGNEKTLLAVADVAGKGISACLFSLGLRSSLRALAANLDSLPDIVKKANELFSKDVGPSSHFATLWIAILQPGKLSFVSLGHPPVLLKRGSSVKELSSTYPALGVAPYENIKATTIDLEEGDELLAYSDGATDAINREGERYGVERLKEAFLHSHNAEELLHRIKLFSQGTPSQDDLTLLYFRSTLS